jgi:hypothetical protein
MRHTTKLIKVKPSPVDFFYRYITFDKKIMNTSLQEDDVIAALTPRRRPRA